VRQLLAAANYVHVPTLWADDSPRYRVAAIQGEVVAVRPDEGCSYMDPISVKYTGARPFPAVVPIGCVCDRGGEGVSRMLGFGHHPALAGHGTEVD
jgi:hypothetical protein